MTTSHVLRRFLAAGVAFGVVATAFGVATSGTAFASSRAGRIHGAGATGAVKDSYIVVLRDKAADTAKVSGAASILTSFSGGTVRHVYSHAVKGFSAKMTEEQAKRLAVRDEVAYVEQNRKVTKSDTQANPPSWGLDRIDQPFLPVDHSYTYPTAASTVHAYVIDTGIRISHQEFGGRASYGYDFVDNDPVADDCAGHGTHVAATVGGNSFGVAKGVRLVAVRVLDCEGNGTDAQVLAGIDWVTANAVKPAVANMSLGGGASAALNEAVGKSIASGVTYAVAAGNAFADACFFSPASAAAAITVGATDQADRRPAFSNFGRCVDVFAPGVDITSAWNNGDSSTRTISGTSMASPHVAGAAALLLATNPAMTPQQVHDAVVNGAVTGAVGNPGIASPNKLVQVGAAAATPATVIRMRARANGLVVTADPAGKSPLIANRTATGPWEEFDVVDAGAGFIGLRAHANGRYVTAESGGASPLIANRTSIGPWEKFKITTNGDGSISLLANANGKYVTAEGAGAAPLIANRNSIGPWEKFEPAVATSMISLFAYANFKYVSADFAGSAPLIANRTELGPWEEFDAIDLGTGYIGLRAHANGKYVTAESGGASPLIANRTSIGVWENFKITNNADGSISLLASANGKYVTAEGAGAAPLIASRSSIGLWEKFEFVG
jgi:subtilisin family serine protease